MTDSNDIKIRLADADDFDTVVSMHFAGLEHELELLNKFVTGKMINPEARGDVIKLLQQIIASGEGKIFVADELQKILGYCLVTQKIYPSEKPRLAGCINGIYVLPDHQRQGIGRKLYDAAEKWLKIQGVRHVELYHMRNDFRAKAFWQKLGYEQVQWNCLKEI